MEYYSIYMETQLVIVCMLRGMCLEMMKFINYKVVMHITEIFNKHDFISWLRFWDIKLNLVNQKFNFIEG